MPAAAGHLRRPLLEFSRKEIQDFAQQNQLSFVEDSSNESTKYTRNLFRLEILPLIEKVYPQVKENLRDNIQRFQEIEQLYRFSTNELTKKLCRQKGNEIHIPIKQLLSYNSRALVFAIIAEYGFTEKQIDEVLKLAESDSGKYIQSPNNAFRIIRHRHWFIVSPVNTQESVNIIIEETDKQISFDSGSLELETEAANGQHLKAGNDMAALDKKTIAFPLLLRKWKQADYFYPLGMKKKKKLSRFFIDQKLSKSDKEKVWVIEMNKKIIWVVGMRIDERFKVTESTRQVLQIAFRS
jgi:tRNA(Ile)-lysidine synthase